MNLPPTFSNIVAETLSYWPKSINLDDKKFFKDGGCQSRTLVRLHDEIEEKIDINNDFVRFMDSALFIYATLEAQQSERLDIHKINLNFLQPIFEDRLDTKYNRECQEIYFQHNPGRREIYAKLKEEGKIFLTK